MIRRLLLLLFYGAASFQSLLADELGNEYGRSPVFIPNTFDFTSSNSYTPNFYQTNNTENRCAVWQDSVPQQIPVQKEQTSVTAVTDSISNTDNPTNFYQTKSIENSCPVWQESVPQQISVQEDQTTETAATESISNTNNSIIFDCDDYLLATYLEYLIGRGVGYDHGYTTLEALYFPHTYKNFCCFTEVQPFLDFRLHFLKDNVLGFNLGGGSRFFCNTFRKVFGVNFYYDYRHSKKSFNQLGLGFEMLSGCDALYDMRLNFYLPIGNRTETCCPFTFKYPGGFFAIATKKQRVLRGMDFELETQWSRFVDPCSCCYCPCFDFYVAAGWYYLHGKCARNVLGGKARLGFEYLDMIRIEGRVYYDTLFKTTVQGLISFVYYFGGDCNCSCANDCCDCDFQCIARQRVMRQEIIVQDKKRCFFETNF